MSDNTKDESYWIGVRDALRMVDSFLRWSRRNPTIAKSLDEFLAEGLVAAAKRCESCLGRELGLKYGKEDPEKGMDDFDIEEDSASGEEPIEAILTAPSEALMESDDEEEIPISEDGAVDIGELVDALMDEGFSQAEIKEHLDEITTAIEEESDAIPVSIDSIEPEESLTPPPSDDLDFGSETGEFTSDFELAEPEPLIIDSEEDESADEPPVSYEVTPPPEMDEEASLPKAGDIDAEPPSEEELEIPSIEPAVVAEAPSEERIWSPYDDPSIHEDEAVTDEDAGESEEDETDEDEEPTPALKRPPPPPPRPETDESEEERRKRARRLFFGA